MMRVNGTSSEGRESDSVYLWGRHPKLKRVQGGRASQHAIARLSQLQMYHSELANNYRQGLYEILGGVMELVHEVRSNPEIERDIDKVTKRHKRDLISSAVYFVMSGSPESSSKMAWRYARVLSYLDQQGVEAEDVPERLRTAGIEKLAREAARIDPRAKTKRQADPEDVAISPVADNEDQVTIDKTLPTQRDAPATGISILFSNDFRQRMLDLSTGARIKLIAERADENGVPLLRVIEVADLKRSQGLS